MRHNYGGKLVYWCCVAYQLVAWYCN